MTQVRLTGELRCRGERDAAVVTAGLPEHVRLTRAEPGCVAFEVTATADPLVWTVGEVFADAEAFRSHQARATASDWGRATAGIPRVYEVVGLPD